MINRPGKSLFYGMLALSLSAWSLSACGPAPNTQPGVTPSASPSAVGTPAPNSSASPLSAASLRFRLMADPSLARFSTAQVNDFSICLAQIARASTRFSFNGALSAAASAALTAAGAQVETSGDSHIITFSSAATLAQLLTGISLSLPEVPAGSLEGRTTFFDSAGLELGFVTWQATLTGGAQDVTVTLSEADGAANPVSNACPRLKANVSGATLRGAGGQVTSGGNGPGASPSPGTGSSPEPTSSPSSAPGEAPGVPTGLQVVEQGATYLTLQWEFPADARSFKLYLDGREVAANHVTPNYYRFEGLRASTNYQLGVRSVNPAGESAIVDTRGTTLAEGSRSASGNFSSGGNGNTSSNRGELTAGDIDQITFSGTMQSAVPDVAMDADGNYLITWVTSDTDRGYGIDIRAQHYNSNGNEVGDEIVLVEYSTSGFTSFAHVSMDDDGNYVLTWSNTENNSPEVFARSYNSNDEPISTTFRVNNYTFGTQAFSDVAMDNDGNFAVSWSGQGASGYGIYTRSFELNGSAISGEVLVDTSGGGPFFTTSAIAMDGDGDFVVAWNEKYQIPFNYEQGVFYRRFELDGTPLDDRQVVSDGTTFSFITFAANPVSVDMNSEGTFAISWPEITPDDGFFETEIKAQLFADSGDPIGDDFTVAVLDSTFPITSTALSLNDDGDFVVSWTDNENSSLEFGTPLSTEVNGRYYTGSNRPLGGAFTVQPPSDNPSAFQFAPAIAMNDDGDFVVTWYGSRGESEEAFSQFEVYKRDFSR